MHGWSLRALGLLALGLAGVLAAQASEEAGDLRFDSATEVAPPADYATEAFARPWDYTDREDIILDGPGPTEGLQDARLEHGLLRFGLEGGGYLSPLWVGFTEEIPEARSGPANPIDAERFTHVSLRLHASERAQAALQWFGCRELVDDCLGGRRFIVRPGWHTYSFRLENEFPGLEMPWAGQRIGLRLTFNAVDSGAFALDWLRVHAPGEEATRVSFTAPSQTARSTLRWQRLDGPTAGPAGRSSGLLGETTGDGPQTFAFDHAALAPGRYRVVVAHDDADGDRIAEDATDEALSVHDPPLPALHAPDRTGGADYATTVLGEPWDMAGPEDVVEVGNADEIAWRDGALHARNAPPDQGDPSVRLRLGPDGVDTDRYHRLTVRMSYEGPFNLENTPGGGTHGRLIWWRAASGPWDFLDGRPIATWTDRDTYTVELRTDPPEAVQEPTNASRLGWAGGRATYLRWDPNEDPGQRRWRLDEVRLRADHEARGSFDIVWEDRNRADRPVEVSLYADTAPSGFGGQQIAEGLTQQPGANVHRWDTSDVEPGTYWIWIEADDGVAVTRRYATGPLQVLDGYQRPPGDHDRVDVNDPVAAAVAISQRRFPASDAAARVVLARADLFADALAGAPLTVDGPLLLVAPAGLGEDVRAEIERVLPDGGEVTLLGGQRVLGERLADELRGAGFGVRRLAGPTRVETAVAIGDHVRALHGATATAVLARASAPATNPTAAWADSVAGGAAAAARGLPLLVTPSHELHPAVRDALQRWGIARTELLGGTAALSRAVAAAVPDPERVAGAARAATAAGVAGALWTQAEGRILVPGYTDRGWAFGLPAAGLAVDAQAPLLLADRLQLPPASADAACGALTLVGGLDQLSRAVEDALAAAAASDCPPSASPASAG